MNKEPNPRGLVENLLASFLFWCPNVLLVVLPMSIKLKVFILAFNYAIIFSLTSVISHVSFKSRG